MSISLFDRVVLLRDLPSEGLIAGDMGVVVEHYAPRCEVPEGYEVEFFAASGDTVAVASVAGDGVRPVTANEVLSVRAFPRAT